MCKKQKGLHNRIDPCIKLFVLRLQELFDKQEKVDKLRRYWIKFDVVGSCCGHLKYPLTIIVRGKVYINKKYIIVLHKSLRTEHINIIKFQLDAMGILTSEKFNDAIKGFVKNTPLDVKNMPYLTNVETKTTTVKKYNPDYGDDRICKCGHPYYRHFDTYDAMAIVGCKYCQCYYFEEKKDKKKKVK